MSSRFGDVMVKTPVRGHNKKRYPYPELCVILLKTGRR